MIRVLVVEDSAVARELLVHILSADPELHVNGTAANGEEALEALKHKKPDVITMDIHLPGMNGFEATRRIMETFAVPIVIVSGSVDTQEIATTFRAMEAGALAVVARPRGPGHLDHEAMAKNLVQTVKLMSEVKVVRRWARARREAMALASPPTLEVERGPGATEIKLIAIGASTGGPLALQTILSRLPKEFSVPVLIVQHIAAGFVSGFTEWLAQTSARPIHLAEHAQQLQPGHVYIAPDGYQMKVELSGKLSLTQAEPENGLRPSVSYLFRSVANVYGQNAVGVLLTGMGKDGANELKLMRDKGAVTLAQDEASSIVHGMPGEAIRLDAATYVLPPEGIGATLASLVKTNL